jgi:hypothetical protein
LTKKQGEHTNDSQLFFFAANKAGTDISHPASSIQKFMPVGVTATVFLLQFKKTLKTIGKGALS